MLLFCLALPASGATEARSLEEQAANLVVRLEGQRGGQPIFGSGILFARQGELLYIATAHHVVRQGTTVAEDLRVQFHFWPDEKFPVQLLEDFDRDMDLAVLRVDLRQVDVPAERIRGIEWERLGDVAELDRGMPVHPMGHPLGHYWFSPMQPPKLHRIVGERLGFEYDCQKGYSGGALFDEHWGLVGMIVSDNPMFCQAVTSRTMIEKLQKEWRYPVTLKPMGPPDLTQNIAAVGTGPTGEQAITVAVVDFDNRSGYPLRDIGPLAHEIITGFLVDLENVHAVSRDRLEALEGERRFQEGHATRRVRTRTVERRAVGDSPPDPGPEGEPPEDGETQISEEQTLEEITEEEVVEQLLRGPDSQRRQRARKVSRQLGADYLLTGSVLRYDVQRRTLRAYGADVEAHNYKMSIALQMIDLDTGEIRFSDTFDVKDRLTYAMSSAPARPPGREYEMLQKLMDQARDRLEETIYEKRRVPERRGRTMIQVRSTPPGAEVYLDGVLVGTTPLSTSAELGIQVVTLKRRGYGTWESAVRVEPDTELDIDLTR